MCKRSLFNKCDNDELVMDKVFIYFIVHLQAEAFASGKTKKPNVKAGIFTPSDAGCLTGINCGSV